MVSVVRHGNAFCNLTRNYYFQFILLQVRRRRVTPTNPCILVERHVLRKDQNGAPQGKRWACQLQGEDVVKAQGLMVELDGIEDSEFDEDSRVRSGYSTLMVQGAEITSGMKMILPNTSEREIGKAKRRTTNSNVFNRKESLKSDKGKKEHRELNPAIPGRAYSLLAIRVTAKDSATTSSKSVLGDDIFGLGTDQINLASRFDTCSNGQLTFEPFNGATTGGPAITDGVYELDISDYRINGKLDSAAHARGSDAGGALCAARTASGRRTRRASFPGVRRA